MNAEQQLEPGQRVGEYVVDRRIGAGAFGAVYRGAQPVIGKVVAIKVLHRQDPETTTRFINEARAVNAIRHPNLVDIFAFGFLEDGRAYLVMEWLEGEPLDAYLDRVGPIAPQSVVPILQPLGRALDAAHTAGIIHRDLKPSNVFLTVNVDGHLVPKLLDFGVAKLAHTSENGTNVTGTGQAIGTPEYMSPEQCRGPDIGHRSDIYAFGALLFRMLTGAPVFRADTAVELMMMHLKTKPPLPSSVLSSLPRALDDSVITMLAKEPDERPANLKTALETYRQALGTAGLDETEPPGVQPKQLAPLDLTLESPSRDTTLPKKTTPGTWAPLIVILVMGLAAIPFLVDFEDPAAELAPPSPAKNAKAPPSPEPPKPPPPLPPSTVSLAFSGLPDGTLILLPSGTILGTSPAPLTLPKSDMSVELRFEKAGYKPARLQVQLSTSATISVTLEPIKRRKKPTPPTKSKPKPAKADKDSVENPY